MSLDVTVSPGDYDPNWHVTAGEFRKLGLKIPKEIPDCAWVPRKCLQFVPAEMRAGASNYCHVSFDVHFEEPFRWLEIRATIEEGD